MLSKEEHQEILKSISELPETTLLMELIAKLQDDFNERQENRIDENLSEDSNASIPVDDNTINWENKYKQLEKIYKDRFFTKPSINIDDTIINKNQPKSFDELFNESEV